MMPQRTFTKYRSMLLPVVLGICFLSPALLYGADFIVRNGQPRGEIVISAEAVPVVQRAAEQLQADVEAMTGAKLLIVNEPTAENLVQIFVGASLYTHAHGIDASELAHGGYHMVSGDGWLALVGRDQRLLDQRHAAARKMLRLARSHPDSEEKKQMWKKWHELTGENWGLPFGQYWKMYNDKVGVSQLDERGSFNAVVGFLRMQGVRRYMRGELGVVIPDKSSIPLPKVNKTVRPDFPVRYAYEHGHRGDIIWQLWMGFNPAADIQGIAYNFHGMTQITGTRGNPLVDEEKPEEFYAMFGGKRDIGGRQCLSSEKLFEANVKYIRAMFDIFDVPMVSVNPSDSYQSLCQCEKCEGKSDPDRPYPGRLSNYVWGYVNRVAKEVYKTHPDRKIVGMSYNTYRLPPDNIDEFSPNLVVSIVQHRKNFAYNAEQFEKVREKRRGFLDLLPGEGPQLLQDDHYRMARGVPTYYMHSIVKDLRSLKGISMGDFLDINNDKVASKQGVKGIRHLNKYVTARYWWDVDQDVDALLDEYYEKFYGPASQQMKAFIEYSEKNWPDMVKSKEKIKKVRSLLKAAQAQVDADSVYGRRIALVAEFIEPLSYQPDRLGRERENVPLQLVADGKGKEITIDGKLDDPMWDMQGDQFSGKLKDTTGDKAPLQTRFKAAWADNNLYFGIYCQDRPEETVNITATGHDQPSIWHGDVVEILLETQVHSYYQLAISPAGALTDLSHEGSELEFAWSSNAQVATHVGDDYWSVEVRIPVAGKDRRQVDPFDGVAGVKPTHEEPWYFNVCRQRVREDSRDTMSFSPTHAGFQQPDRFAKLVRRNRAETEPQSDKK